ncbi:MAG: nitroreductase [Bacteroidales bacterium]|nr:nitroreductase [Bacteroidales bacterium]
MKNIINLCLLLLLVATACNETPKTNADMRTESQQEITSNEIDNPVIQTIMARRSIRAYKSTPVSQDTLDVIMKCAVNAPNAMNRQSWEVRIVDDKNFIDGITAIFKETVVKGGDERMIKMVEDSSFVNMFRNAPTVIFVAGDDGRFTQIDCGLLGENIMLAAQSLGLGTCCLGSPVAFFEQPEAADYLQRLDLSEGYKLLYAIAIGYPDETPEAKPRDGMKVRYVD